MAPETRATAAEKAAEEAQVVPAMADFGIHTADETGPGVVPVHVAVDEVGSGAVAGTRVKAEAKATGAPLVGTEDRGGAPGETLVKAEAKATGAPLVGTEDRGGAPGETLVKAEAGRKATGTPLAMGTEEGVRGLAEARVKADMLRTAEEKATGSVGTEELGRGLAEAATKKRAAADPGARAVAVAAQEGRGPMAVPSDKVGEPMPEAAAQRFWMIPQHGVNSIALKTNDDHYFFVPEDFVKPFKTVYGILEFGRGDSDADLTFPLPNVDGRTLSIALEWQASVESGDTIELGPVDGLEVKDLYSLMYAGEYLEHEELVKAACSAVAYRMCDKTTDQIRETASFARCFPDLYETIRHELTSTWAKGRPMF